MTFKKISFQYLTSRYTLPFHLRAPASHFSVFASQCIFCLLPKNGSIQKNKEKKSSCMHIKTGHKTETGNFPFQFSTAFNWRMDSFECTILFRFAVLIDKINYIYYIDIVNWNWYRAFHANGTRTHTQKETICLFNDFILYSRMLKHSYIDTHIYSMHTYAYA